MDLLVIGGTRFLGRHVVVQALAAGHRVTLLHRGRSAPGLFPEAEHRIADRNGDLAALAEGRWDAVIDTSAYVPRQVRTIVQALRGRVGHYQLVSTISVYADGQRDIAEDAPLQSLADATTETIDGSTYGGLKALCEQVLLDALPQQACIVRPGLIVGPHDPTGRFGWWVQRFTAAAADGGEVLAPGDPAGPVQLIDARDLAAFMLSLADAGARGTFNATGPLQPLTMQGLLEAARDTLAPAATLCWVDEDFLLQQGVQPWVDLPLWLDRAASGTMTVDLARARAAGLACRPLVQTLRDTADWAATQPAPSPATAATVLRPPVGLAPEREAALRAAWKAR